jgi:hypothetical protein
MRPGRVAGPRAGGSAAPAALQVFRAEARGGGGARWKGIGALLLVEPSRLRKRRQALSRCATHELPLDRLAQ